MSNLKPAPLPLTADLVAKLTGDRPALGRGIVQVRIEGTLIDRPDEPDDVDQFGGGLDF